MRLADGDRDAFHPVFVALLPLLRGFAARAVPPEDAEDVAQEALLKVFLHAAAFDRSRDALSWALGIAAYEIKTHRRRRQRRRESPEPPTTLADGRANPETRAVAVDLEDAIEAALGALDSGDAATLRAYARGERPDGVAAPTFRKRVERGLARLRARWRAIHDGR